jgi:hypothetical protein
MLRRPGAPVAASTVVARRLVESSLGGLGPAYTLGVAFYQRKESEISTESTADDVVAVLRPGNVVFNTIDPEGLSEFWRNLTGYEPRPLFGDYRSLRDPERRGPNLTFQPSDTTGDAPGRCHVDFYADDPDDAAERALRLGAEFVRRVDQGDVFWIVLSDPEGNEFCVVRAVGPDRRT